MAVESGKIKRLIITLPPRHGKSQLASINFPAWFLGKNPDKEIIISSYNADLAQDFGTKTRDLVNDDAYKRIFDIELKVDEKSKSKWRTTGGGTYTAVGVGGAITGRGADIFIIDDPLKNREDANSDSYRNKQWDWYRSTCYTRLENNASIVLILTRWHFDDLAGRLLDEQEKGGEKWEVVNLPAIATEDEKFRKKGEPLWADKYDIEALENIKKVVGLSEFASLYQQTPVMAEYAEFKPEYFRYFEDIELRDKKMAINILVDPAISKRDEACNTGIISVAKKAEEPYWYVLDDDSGKKDPYQLVNILFHKVEEYEKQYPMANVRIWIETNAYQEALVYILKEEMRRREKYISINELKSRTDKNGRIRGLIPLYRQGIVKHRTWMKNGAMELELVQFPYGKNIDRIDALAFNLLAVAPTRTKNKRPYIPLSDSLTGY